MKRHKSLYPLSHDHQHALVLAQKLKFSKKPTSSTKDETSELKAELTGQFEKMLRPHFEREEKYLAPLFTGNELMKRMLDEHKKLAGLCNKIAQNPERQDTKQLREKINLFGELLDLHIRFEERELFPMIEKNLSEEQLKTLGEKLLN